MEPRDTDAAAGAAEVPASAQKAPDAKAAEGKADAKGGGDKDTVPVPKETLTNLINAAKSGGGH